MTSVLISIKPEWCEQIATGKKTIEVRKTKPKILPPFRCYIYCTKGGGDFANHFYEDADGNFIADGKTYSAFLSGHVIGEFVCDWCDPFPLTSGSVAELALGSCLTPREIYEYAKEKTPYGWHITDLKLYAEPKELKQFQIPTTYPARTVRMAPQSWCYIEEI